jgi:transketolase
MAARDLLQAEGIGTRVVSMPCWELFEEQDEAYRRRVLPGGPVRVAVEAAIRFGWDRWLYGERGQAGEIGLRRHARLRRLGPGKDDLYEHFGITPRRWSRRSRGCCEQSHALIVSCPGDQPGPLYKL